MWTPDPPEPAAALRQGDLLVNLALPKLTWPLSYARPPGQDASEGQPVLVTSGKLQTYLVVSQCCVIENKTVAALARVRTTKPLTPDEIRDLERELPSDDPEVSYAFSEHALKPVEEHLERKDRKIWVADFASIQTYSGSITDFQASRVAAMSPEGRAALRVRLGAFWARAEAEDEQHLKERGMPLGFTLELVPAAPPTAAPEQQLRSCPTARCDWLSRSAAESFPVQRFQLVEQVFQLVPSDDGLAVLLGYDGLPPASVTGNRLPPPRRVVPLLPAGQRLGRRPRVPGQRSHRRVPRLRHQHRRRRAVLGIVRQRRVPELVQRPRAAPLARGGFLEDLRRAPVRQPGLPARCVDIARRQLDAGPAVGQEQRASLAALQ